MNRARFLLASAAVAFLAAAAAAQNIIVKPSHDRGIYQPSETIRWSIQVRSNDAPEARYVIKKGGITEVRKGVVPLTNGKGELEASLAEPGWLLAEISVAASTGKTVRSLGGALVSPEKIARADKRPDDFDSFWEAKLAELAAVPPNVHLDPANGGKANVEYFKVTMDNIRGSHIRGQLARPASGGKLPAMLIVQWAGVYPLQKGWVTGPASEGWLCLNINAHDLPIDEPDSFYKTQNDGPLSGYPAIGNDNRETSYFLRMYLSCYRAAQYLADRPDWDGRTLIVTGGSQGGLQTFVTAALHPKITAGLAAVPAGCDLNGPVANRLPGWPMWYWATKGKDETKVREASRYYDVVNFASRIKCPLLVGVGLIDTTCPSPGVFAACNQLAGPKEIVPLPLGEHGEKNGSHAPYYARFNAWKAALVKGLPAPVQ